MERSALSKVKWILDRSGAALSAEMYTRKFIPAEGRKEAVVEFKPEEALYHAATNAKPKE